MKKLVIIDTFNFLHRAYHAIPKSFRSSDNTPTNAVYGVSSMIVSLINETKPDFLIAALDSKGPTFRSEEFVNYKAHRKELEEDLAIQIPLVFEALDSFGVQKIVCEGYEADDVIGTLVERYDGKYQIFIVSNDKDLWQLISPTTFILLPNTKGGFEKVDNSLANEKLGFDKKYLVDYKAIRGDVSDNIPGVRGIGEIGAKKLIDKYHTLENIYDNIDSVEPESTKKKLIENVEIAHKSKMLATIIRNAPISNIIEAQPYFIPQDSNLKDFLVKYNFKSLIKRVGMEVATVSDSKQESLF
jgi:DNA polymerase I